LWLANCYFAHNSLRFPALLPFFNASSLRPFHPPNRRPDPVAPTWRRPFPRCRVLSAQPPVVRNNSVDFKVQPIREANPAYPLYIHCCLTGTAHNRWTRDSGRDKPGAEMNQRVLPKTPLFSIPADCLPHEKIEQILLCGRVCVTQVKYGTARGQRQEHLVMRCSMHQRRSAPMSSAILSAKEQQVIDSTFPCHCPRCHQERLRFVLLENGAVCAQCWNETHPVVPIQRAATAH
jgi:hypothetical protein